MANGNGPNNVVNFQGRFPWWLHVLGPSLAQVGSLDAPVSPAAIAPRNYPYIVENQRISSTSTLEILRVHLKDIFINFGILLLPLTCRLWMLWIFFEEMLSRRTHETVLPCPDILFYILQWSVLQKSDAVAMKSPLPRWMPTSLWTTLDMEPLTWHLTSSSADQSTLTTRRQQDLIDYSILFWLYSPLLDVDQFFSFLNYI